MSLSPPHSIFSVPLDMTSPSASADAAAARNGTDEVTESSKHPNHISKSQQHHSSLLERQNSATLRYRRTKSVTRAEEITTKEQKQRRQQPDKP